MSTYKLSDFDFSGKRVRYRGKCQTKFELSFKIAHIEPTHYLAIYIDFPYQDYVSYLKSHLS